MRSGTASGAETPAIAASVAASDAASGTQAALVGAAIAAQDAATGSDAASGAAAIAASDVVNGSDAVDVYTGSAAKALDLADSALGSDAITVTKNSIIGPFSSGGPNPTTDDEWPPLPLSRRSKSDELVALAVQLITCGAFD